MSNGCDHPYDINNDGWTDVISNGWFGDQNVYWYQNPGRSEDKWRQHLLIESAGTEFTFFEDIDGDGDPDLIPSHWEKTDLCWYENNAVKLFYGTTSSCFIFRAQLTLLCYFKVFTAEFAEDAGKPQKMTRKNIDFPCS